MFLRFIFRGSCDTYLKIFQKHLFENTHKFLLILPKAASAVMKGFRKAAYRQLNKFLKDAELNNFLGFLKYSLQRRFGNKFMVLVTLGNLS
jgi:hypothetical protein